MGRPFGVKQIAYVLLFTTLVCTWPYRISAVIYWIRTRTVPVYSRTMRAVLKGVREDLWKTFLVDRFPLSV